MALFGCDTFVVLPPLTANGDIIFGKNSDRPNGEVQEVIYVPPSTCDARDKLKCTYIEVDQVSLRYGVLLSKPAWMWGAEMGANDRGVVIGNEAVWTVVEDECSTERLLGMDLLRLGLERASSSSEAVNVITKLLETYGQGGPCSDTDSDLLYHNSFLIADQKEAWVLETAGKLWAAEKITNGYRNISNCLSIGINISSKSDQLVSFALEKNVWSGKGEFNFKQVFSTGECPREAAGSKLLSDLTSEKKFDVQQMFQILRNKQSGICRPSNDPFHTSGSWVSALGTANSGSPPCHWVTATPDPSVSVFKPFVFSPSPVVSPHLVSPIFSNDPAKVVPRFQFRVDRRHKLYKIHETALKNCNAITKLKVVENKLLEDTSNILMSLQEGKTDITSCNELLKNAVDVELNIYSS